MSIRKLISFVRSFFVKQKTIVVDNVARNWASLDYPTYLRRKKGEIVMKCLGMVIKCVNENCLRRLNPFVFRAFDNRNMRAKKEAAS